MFHLLCQVASGTISGFEDMLLSKRLKRQHGNEEMVIKVSFIATYKNIFKIIKMFISFLLEVGM